MFKHYRISSSLSKALPILLPSLANRCGTIGLALVPMLLVDRHFDTSQSAFAMTVIKSSALLGVFLGGWLTDFFFIKTVIITSFLLSALGMSALPHAQSLSMVCLLGMCAQVGQSMFPSSSQLMIRQLLPVNEQQEAVGWLRTANNLGQILSYSIGLFFAGAGMQGLMLFDGLTSVGAACMGYRSLPGAASHSYDLSIKNNVSGMSRPLCLMMLMSLCFSFLYELFMTGAAAQMRMHYGDGGLQFFSMIMLINTVLCTLFSVQAARHLKNPALILPLGIILATLGCVLLFTQNTRLVILGAFALTLGEILFFSLSSFVLLQLSSQSKKSGRFFGVASLFQVLGRILGASLAFPLISWGVGAVGVILSVGAIAVFAGQWGNMKWGEPSGSAVGSASS